MSERADRAARLARLPKLCSRLSAAEVGALLNAVEEHVAKTHPRRTKQCAASRAKGKAEVGPATVKRWLQSMLAELTPAEQLSHADTLDRYLHGARHARAIGRKRSNYRSPCPNGVWNYTVASRTGKGRP